MLRKQEPVACDGQWQALQHDDWGLMTGKVIALREFLGRRRALIVVRMTEVLVGVARSSRLRACSEARPARRSATSFSCNIFL